MPNDHLYLKHYTAANGYTKLFTAGDGALIHISFGIQRLSAGQSLTFGPFDGQETALTILTGALSADDGKGQHWQKLGGRTTVFDGGTDTLLLPSGSNVVLKADNACEIAVSQAASDHTGPVYLYAGSSGVDAHRGLPGWERDVRTYIDSGVQSSGDAQRLILGETINGAGQWSSFPQHKHDRDNLPLEAKLEEVYLFRIDPPTGFAFQGLFEPDDPSTANRAYIVRDNDVVAIPRGYHPVAATPGHRVYYFWVLAGIGHELKFYTDEAMRWLQPGL